MIETQAERRPGHEQTAENNGRQSDCCGIGIGLWIFLSLSAGWVPLKKKSKRISGKKGGSRGKCGVIKLPICQSLVKLFALCVHLPFLRARTALEFTLFELISSLLFLPSRQQTASHSAPIISNIYFQFRVYQSRHNRLILISRRWWVSSTLWHAYLPTKTHLHTTSETPEGVVGGIDSCSLLLLRSIGEARDFLHQIELDEKTQRVRRARRKNIFLRLIFPTCAQSCEKICSSG